MSNVSIYEKSWIDLVFEGKNKAYGAYKLRQEDSKTSLIALLGGITFFLTVIGGGLFLTSFNSAPIDGPEIVIDYNPITPVDLSQQPEIKKPEVQQLEQQPPTTVEVPQIANLVVAATSEVTVNVPTNAEVVNTPPATEGVPGGTGLPNPGNESGTAVTPSLGDGGDGPKKTNELDVLPEYPGGMKRFYEYVARNFDSPEIDEDGEITMNVIVSFVIEKDGSLTDIKAVRSTDYKMEREAIRILKASRVKWKAGIKDGEPVRTLFLLPIKVKL